VGAVPVLDGLEPLERTDCGGVGFVAGRCASDDQPIAPRDCGEKKPIQLSGEIEADEVYIVAGHKGLPAEVAKAGRKGRRRRLKGKRGRGTLAGDKPPVLGLLQRDGEVVIRMLPNVQQLTIQPVITCTVAPGSQVYTDEYDIYDRLPEWGYHHKKVNHSAGEYARDEDGDGFLVG